MSALSDAFKKFINVKSEDAQVLKSELINKFNVEIKQPLEKAIKDAKKYGIKIDITVGKKKQSKRTK